MATKMNITDELVHTTVRISCSLGNGEGSIGTGFILNFCEHDGETVPAIVTNRHVIEDSTQGVFNITMADQDGAPKPPSTNCLRSEHSQR